MTNTHRTSLSFFRSFAVPGSSVPQALNPLARETSFRSASEDRSAQQRQHYKRQHNITVFAPKRERLHARSFLIGHFLWSGFIIDEKSLVDISPVRKLRA